MRFMQLEFTLYKILKFSLLSSVIHQLLLTMVLIACLDIFLTLSLNELGETHGRLDLKTNQCEDEDPFGYPQKSVQIDVHGQKHDRAL
jgi:hypothetical protein